MTARPPVVRPLQPISAAVFQQMAAAVRACRVIAGAAVRTRETPDGTIVDFLGGDGGSFVGAWFVSMRSGEEFAIRPGTINRVMARIKDRPLDDDPAPTLKVPRLQLDRDGRGYIAAEVTVDPKKAFAVLKVEMVQCADPDTDDGEPGAAPNAVGAQRPLAENRARFPVAMLRRRKGGRLDLYQLAFFDLQHRLALTRDGQAAARHFFW